MLLYAFPSMFVRSLREFPGKSVFTYMMHFVEYMHRKLVTANFLSYDNENRAVIGFAY